MPKLKAWVDVPSVLRSEVLATIGVRSNRQFVVQRQAVDATAFVAFERG